MKYLLTAIDVANKMLGVDTIATNAAVDILVKKTEKQFCFDCLVDCEFSISAAGTFYIDWGNGTIETIKKTDISSTGLTGMSAQINGQYLYEIWPNATKSQVGSMYAGNDTLGDYDNIPNVWKEY